MSELEQPIPPIIKLNWDEIDEGLTDNQQEALRFIAAGFGNIEASKSIGMHRSVISQWLRRSIDFLNAYERVVAEIRKYNERMLEFVTTAAWLRIHQYLIFDPAALIKDPEIPPTIAKTLIQEQGRMLRHVAGGIRPQTYIVEHDVTPALLQATENAAAIVADRMAELSEQGEIVDVTATVAEYRRAIAPPVTEAVAGKIAVDYKQGKLQCPECRQWFPDLRKHCSDAHELSMDQLREKHGLSPNSPRDFDTALRHPLQ